MQACRNEGWTQATAKSCASFVSHRMPWSPSVSQCHAKAINFRAIYTQTPALAGKALLGIKISEPSPTLSPPPRAHARASFRQARSPSHSLQDDIILKACAHTFLQHRPSLSAVDWFKGSNAQPIMMSLNPKGLRTLSCIFPPALLRSLPLSVIPSPSPSVVFFGWVMASMSSPSPLVDREAPQSFAADINGLECHRCRQQYPCSRVPRHHGRFERRWDGRGDEWRFRGWGGRCSERGSDQGTERENKHAGGRERAVAFGCG